MKFLPVENHLTNAIEWDNDSLEGILQCDCGSNLFGILHNGTQHRTLFFRPYISSDGKEFVIIAQCASCSKKFPLHWSEGKQPDALPDDAAEFLLPRIVNNRWAVEIHYEWNSESGKQDGHWTDEYIDVNIDIFNAEHPKKIRVFES